MKAHSCMSSILLEDAMSTFTTFSVVPMPKASSSDPVIKRRQKLLYQLEQQRALAVNPRHVIEAKKWVRQDDGSRRLVERQRTVRRWWVMDADGQCYLTIRYGAKILELEKGKTAILVGEIANLPSIINAVAAAVENGEFDTLAKAAYGSPRFKRKSL